MKKEKIYLVLENGEYFAGDSFGGDFETVYGEVVFNTSITGYLESITDPSYCGQILVQTFPLIETTVLFRRILKARDLGFPAI